VPGGRRGPKTQQEVAGGLGWIQGTRRYDREGGLPYTRKAQNGPHQKAGMKPMNCWPFSSRWFTLRETLPCDGKKQRLTV